MLPFQKLPIQRKLMVIIMLTTCLALGLACAAFFGYELATAYSEVKDYYLGQARILGKSCVAALRAREPRQAAEFMAALEADPRLVAACIYDERGQGFVHYLRPRDQPPNFEFPRVQLEGWGVRQDRLEVFQRISYGRDFIGTVYVLVDLEPWTLRLGRYAAIVLVVLLAATGLALAVSSRLHGVISKPVLHLAQTANEVAARNNYSLRAIKQSDDELGHLVGSFNWMLTQIQARDAELQKAQTELEQRINDRTSALSQANEMLRQENLERQKAEEALRNSQQKLLLHIQQTPLGAIDWNLQFEAVNWNPAAEKIFGYSEAEAIGRHACDLIVPESAHQAVGQGWQDLLAQRGGRHSIQENRTKDGRLMTCEWFNTPLVNREGQVVGVASLVQDITQRVQAERALCQSEERFSKAFRASPMAISIATLEIGRFLDVNDSFLSLFGYQREEVIGQTVYELGLWVNPDDRAQLVQRVKDNRVVRDQVCRFRTKTGESRSALTSVELIELGHEPCLLFITHDITDRLKLEEQLRQSQKMEAVGQLAAGVAHDFNNILTIIKGHTSLMLAKAIQDPAVGESLKQVNSATDRAANLVRQLLAFSRRQVMQPIALDLNETVNNMTRMLTRVLGEDITLQFDYVPQPPPIQADTGMIEQIILNLAVNARDAMPEGGTLTIRTALVNIGEDYLLQHSEARPGHFLSLVVSDTGCGMEPAVMKRIFEPFFTTKATGKGTGLGLAMVYGIVKQHAGWIEVESQVGRGATFTIFFPCAQGVAVPAPPAESPAVTITDTLAGHETILVVEDENALRELVRDILQYYGYQVLDATKGSEALAVWERQKGRIDLLLTDMVMPEGMTGRDLAARLLAQKPELKVIFTSGYSLDLVAKNFALRAGCNFLAKPYHPITLVQTVRDCLDGRTGANTTIRAIRAEEQSLLEQVQKGEEGQNRASPPTAIAPPVPRAEGT